MKRGNLTAYKNWAPDGVLWTEWVKPVLFADAPSDASSGANDDAVFDVRPPHVDEANSVFEVKPPPVDWTESIPEGCAVILDLPGKKGVKEGITLARKGYRPIPLYNGVCGKGKSDLVNTHQIAEALFAHADELPALNIDDDAPPAFLLDSNRDANGASKGLLRPGIFDNRWCVFPQDMPSAEFLKKHGINKALVYSKVISDDLNHILYRYQQQGIVIRQYDGKNPIKVIRASKPSAFKSAFYRFKVMLGLSRNASGGFGDIIPEPSSSSGGG